LRLVERLGRRWGWGSGGWREEDEEEDEAIEVGRKIGGRKIGEAVGMGEWRVEGGGRGGGGGD
jgi:hypothetical protein